MLQVALRAQLDRLGVSLRKICKCLTYITTTPAYRAFAHNKLCASLINLPAFLRLQDAEVVCVGARLTDPAFVRVLHAALRALLDRLGVRSFNVGVGHFGNGRGSPVVARIVSRQVVAAAA
jgi:hypothetical protein